MVVKIVRQVADGTGEYDIIGQSLCFSLPVVGQEVGFMYKLTRVDGTVLETHEPYGPSSFFTLGRDEVIPGLETIIKTMRVGDHWELEIPSEDAHGFVGSGYVVKPEETLLMDIELVEICKPKRSGANASGECLSYPEQIQLALEHKQKGGDHLLKGEPGKAIVELNEGLAYFTKINEWPDMFLPTAVPVQLALYLNLSLAAIKCEQWFEAKVAAHAALSIDASNTKATYRRGLACMHLGELDQAVRDLLTAAKKDPQNREVRATYEEAKAKLGVVHEKERKLFGQGKMSNLSGHMEC